MYSQVESHAAKGNNDLRMHARDFASKSVHSTSRLTRLNVAPYHRCHITLVIHKPGIEVWSVIRVCRDDVGFTTREGVLEEVEHAEELACWNKHMVAEETGTGISAGAIGQTQEAAYPEITE